MTRAYYNYGEHTFLYSKMPYPCYIHELSSYLPVADNNTHKLLCVCVKMCFPSKTKNTPYSYTLTNMEKTKTKNVKQIGKCRQSRQATTTSSTIVIIIIIIIIIQRRSGTVKVIAVKIIIIMLNKRHSL